MSYWAQINRHLRHRGQTSTVPLKLDVRQPKLYTLTSGEQQEPGKELRVGKLSENQGEHPHMEWRVYDLYSLTPDNGLIQQFQPPPNDTETVKVWAWNDTSQELKREIFHLLLEVDSNLLGAAPPGEGGPNEGLEWEYLSFPYELEPCPEPTGGGTQQVIQP